MLKSIIAAGAVAGALSFAGAAQAQAYLPDWGIADMRAAVVGSGATIVREDNTGDPYIAAKTPGGLKFTIQGRVCEGANGAKRCKGAFLQSSFTLESDAEVDAAVKKWAPQYAAISCSNDGEKGMLVSRYLIFDYGIHKENLELNISVFYGIAEQIWDAV